MDCSILIATRNRATHLRQTLSAFHQLSVPHGLQVELIIVDNGSTDSTRQIVAQACLTHMDLRYVHVADRGKSNAINQALNHARGRVLLFTDDDVEPSRNWLTAMSKPLLEGVSDAVTGIILLAARVQRPWLSRTHLLWLAERKNPQIQNPELVGANMAVRRDAICRIGGFDNQLGPGMTGLGEDTLLWLQMRNAGMKITAVRDAYVVHRLDPVRLERCSWIDAARQMGNTHAYLSHHWRHHTPRFLLLEEFWNRAKLLSRLVLESAYPSNKLPCPEWELIYRMRIHQCSAMRRMRHQPRRYIKQSFTKNNVPMPQDNLHVPDQT
jgi:glycosyltransferase involved in cell wall biosynthesis